MCAFSSCVQRRRATRSSGFRISAGFDIGARRPKRQGLLAYGSSLIYSNSDRRHPHVLGAPAQGVWRRLLRHEWSPLRSRSLQLSYGRCRVLRVMEGRTLAIATYNTKLDDDFSRSRPRIRGRTGQDRRRHGVRSKLELTPTWIPLAGRSARWTPTRSSPSATFAAWLERAGRDASYQANGYRRVKNPRIWSLHDLAVLTQGGRR